VWGCAFKKVGKKSWGRRILIRKKEKRGGGGTQAVECFPRKGKGVETGQNGGVSSKRGEKKESNGGTDQRAHLGKERNNH